MRDVIQCTVSATSTIKGGESFSLLPASPWVAPSATGGATANCETSDQFAEHLGL